MIKYMQSGAIHKLPIDLDNHRTELPAQRSNIENRYGFIYIPFMEQFQTSNSLEVCKHAGISLSIEEKGNFNIFKCFVKLSYYTKESWHIRWYSFDLTVQRINTLYFRGKYPEDRFFFFIPWLKYGKS